MMEDGLDRLPDNDRAIKANLIVLTGTEDLGCFATQLVALKREKSSRETGLALS